MRIVFIGTVEFSRKMLIKLMDLKADIVGVVTKEKSDFNADFKDISDIPKAKGIPCRYTEDINSEHSIEWIRGLKPDIIFCFGFSQILKKGFLNIAPMGVVGYHPAKLPQNRGRHPIIWALVLGLEKTASTFFFMDEGADSGDILSQTDIDINYDDDAACLYQKIIETAQKQVEGFLPALQSGKYERIPQDHTASNCWRKRYKQDGQIDFRMTNRAIYNLVRGLSIPYVGAHVVYKGKEVKVWKADEVTVDLDNIEFGKVLDVQDRQIIIKCGIGAIRLVEHEFEVLPSVGDYIR